MMHHSTWVVVVMRALLAWLAIGSLAAPPPPPPRPRPVALSRRLWGVEVHWGSPPAGNGAEQRQVAQAAQVVRDDFSWAATERAAGVYNFSQYEELLDGLERAGVTTMFTLDYGNALHTASAQSFPVNASERAAFVRWSLAAMRQFRGRNVIWELWNEPEGIGGLSRPAVPEAYAALCKELGSEMRRTPSIASEALVGPAAAGVDWPLVSSLGRLGCLQYLDAVSVHPCECCSSLSRLLPNLKKLLRRLGARSRVVAGRGLLRDSVSGACKSAQRSFAHHCRRMGLRNLQPGC